MNIVRKNLLIALAALSVGGAAMAQAPVKAVEGQRPALTQEQRAAKMAEHRAKMQARKAERQKQLHDALKLNASQEQAWNTFVAASKPAERAKPGDHAARASLSAPERMERMIERSKQRTAAMEQRLAALKTFYAVLTPEQQKVFDEQAMRGKHGKRGHRFHGGHGGHGAMHG